jgi:hypothetical protein
VASVSVAMTGWRFFAIGVLSLAIAGAVGAIVVRLVTSAPFLPVTFGFGPTTMIAFLVMGLSWASIGAFLVIRRPENAVGRLMVLSGTGYSLSMFFVAVTFALAADETAEAQHLAEVTGWITVMFTQVGSLAFLVALIFPTGRGHSPFWASIVRLSYPGILLVSSLLLLQPGPLHLFLTLQNPIGVGPDIRAGQQVSPLVDLFAVTLAPAITISLASRYRAAGHTERQQLKWFALALVLSLCGVGFSAWGAGRGAGTSDEIGLTVFGFAAAAVPVAIAIAILRHHLYDIDRIISRTISYAVVSAVLGLVFGGVIVVMSAALAAFAEGQTIAVAASTLTAFVAFQPVLRRVRGNVDRRFDRARYDAEQTVAGFSARLRDEVDIATVTTDLRSTVEGAVNPASVGLWIREAKP